MLFLLLLVEQMPGLSDRCTTLARYRFPPRATVVFSPKQGLFAELLFGRNQPLSVQIVDVTNRQEPRLHNDDEFCVQLLSISTCSSLA
jgi:hypothetical protein